MTGTINVFKPEDILKAIESRGIIKVLKFVARKGNKNFKIRYANAVFYVEFKNGPNQVIISMKDVEITSSLQNPKEIDETQKDWGITFTTNIDKSGKFGELIKLLNDEWLKQATEGGDAHNVLTIGKFNRIIPVIQTKYSENCKNVELRNTTLESPIIRMKIDFKCCSDKHPLKPKRGKPMTIFYDYNTKHIKTYKRNNKECYKYEHDVFKIGGIYKEYVQAVSNGKKYKCVKVEGGELVNSDNVWKIIQPGAIIKDGRCFMTSINCSQNSASWPKYVGRVVLQPAVEQSFDDEEDDDDAYNKLAEGEINDTEEKEEEEEEVVEEVEEVEEFDDEIDSNLEEIDSGIETEIDSMI